MSHPACTEHTGRPDVLVVPDCRTNRDFPSVAAAYISTLLDCPVVDLNTSATNVSRRIFQEEWTHYGFVTPSRAAGEFRKLSSRISKENTKSSCTVTGPVDIQCCYPFISSPRHYHVGPEFGDALPFPCYQNFDTWEIIRSRWTNADWFYPILTSLGCPFGCIYCACRKRRVRFRSIENCLGELSRAGKELGIKKFMVIDDCLNADINRAKDFCVMADSLGMEWMAGNGLRADRFDKELAILMKNSGCRRVAFGVESTEDKVLDRIRKGETFQQIDNAVTIARDLFDIVNVFLILGLPGSTWESDRKGIEWALKKEVSIHVSFYVPFDQGMQTDTLFDDPGRANLPSEYDRGKMLELYEMARKCQH